MDILSALRQIKIFSHFSENQIRTLMDAGITRRYANNHWIVYQGDIWPYLFFIIDGDVIAVKKFPEGRSLILETITTGEIFWGLAFFLDEAPMPAGLRSASGCELLLWTRQQLFPLCMEDGRLSWELAQLAIRRALRASAIVDELAFQPVSGRLARFLVEKYGENQQERFARSMTLDDMAARIGSTREMVCRILQRFADQDLIQITRTEFSFIDREKLRQIAQKTKNNPSTITGRRITSVFCQPGGEARNGEHREFGDAIYLQSLDDPKGGNNSLADATNENLTALIEPAI